MEKNILCKAMLIFILFISLFYITYDTCNAEENSSIYLKKINTLKKISRKEKDWILSNQDKSGAIYMYDQVINSNNQYVNPYFASLAADGLLKGDVSKEDINGAKSYLKWHVSKFLKENGEISNYNKVKGQFVSTGQKDSVDSYVAFFLSLLSDYGLKTGSIKDVDPGGKALIKGINKLESLTYKGLTSAIDNSNVYYLMDNLEVYKSYGDVLKYLNSNGDEIMSAKKLSSLKNKIVKLRKNCLSSMKSKLWNKTKKRFEIGIDKNGKVIKYVGFRMFYPDAVCQIYSYAFTSKLASKTSLNNLYNKFCKTYDWENLNFSKSATHIWANLSYIAACKGNYSRCETYIDSYGIKTNISRGYPFYTAEAGWLIKSSNKLIEHYEKY